MCFIKAGDKERKVHGKRRVWLTVTRDEDTDRLYITVPGTEGRKQRRVSKGDRVGNQHDQREQLQQDRRGTEYIGGLSSVK